MSDKKQEMNFHGEVHRDRLVSLLRELADGFERGSVPVESGSKRVLLAPVEVMDVHMKACVKLRSTSLKIEVDWENQELKDLKIGH